MKPFIYEVLPALLAILTMGLAATLLMILFETLRSHWQMGLVRANATPPVEQPLTEANPSDWDAENKSAEEAQAPKLRFDGDVDIFARDFTDPINTSPRQQDAPCDPVPEQECIAPVASRIEQDNEPAIQAELIFHDHKQTEPAQAQRDDKPRQRGAKSDRRRRKTETLPRPDEATEEPRRRAKKERDAGTNEARELRRQSRRGNSA